MPQASIICGKRRRHAGGMTYDPPLPHQTRSRGLRWGNLPRQVLVYQPVNSFMGISP